MGETGLTLLLLATSIIFLITSTVNRECKTLETYCFNCVCHSAPEKYRSGMDDAQE